MRPSVVRSSFCEQHPPIGNIRDQSFPEIWHSDKAVALRHSIWAKECFCTNEVFLWPSIVFQPKPLAQAMWGSKAWRTRPPLGPDERVDVSRLDRHGMPPQTTQPSSEVPSPEGASN